MKTIETASSDMKERLSLAYLTAVAARAGCQISEPKVDRNGIDATIRPISGAAVGLDVQMKAVARDIRIEEGKVISFPLDTATYKKLRRTDTQYPQLLVVFEMPDNEDHWLVVHPGDRTTTLKYTAYWTDLYGRPSVDTETTAVHIPAHNLFDHQAITTILTQAHNLALEGKSWGRER